jgi:hypothetical protein
MQVKARKMCYLFNLGKGVTVLNIDYFNRVYTSQNPKHVLINKATVNKRLSRAINSFHSLLLIQQVSLTIKVKMTHQVISRACQKPIRVLLVIACLRDVICVRTHITEKGSLHFLDVPEDKL